MPRLILLNGPPAAGKSTLARRYTADHPLSLCLDVDVVRSLLGDWLERPEAVGTAARALALVMAREHLTAGHDVVVPHFLARPQLPEQLESLGHQVGADFAEVVIDVDPDVMLESFTQQTAEKAHGEHRDAADLLERTGGQPSRDLPARQVSTAARPSFRDGGRRRELYSSLSSRRTSLMTSAAGRPSSVARCSMRCPAIPSRSSSSGVTSSGGARTVACIAAARPARGSCCQASSIAAARPRDRSLMPAVCRRSSGGGCRGRRRRGRGRSARDCCATR